MALADRLRRKFTPTAFGEDQAAFDARLTAVIEEAQAATVVEEARYHFALATLYGEEADVVRRQLSQVSSDGEGAVQRSELAARLSHLAGERARAEAHFATLTAATVTRRRTSGSVDVEVTA